MKTAIWAVLAAILAGAVGFYGGVTYQQAQTPTFASRSGQGTAAANGAFPGAPGGLQGQNGQRGTGRMGGGSATTGTVMAQDTKSITVKTADGGSKTVFISETTRISEQQQLTAADIKVGQQVAAFGQTAGGGIDARSITVAPPGETLRFGGPGGF